MCYLITLTITNWITVWIGIKSFKASVDFLHPRSGALSTIVKLMSWAVVLRVTTDICYNLKSTWFRIVSSSGAMTELSDFSLILIWGNVGHHDCLKRQNVLSHSESPPAFLLHLFWNESWCSSPSSVSVSWALVLRGNFKGRVEKVPLKLIMAENNMAL